MKRLLLLSFFAFISTVTYAQVRFQDHIIVDDADTIDEPRSVFAADIDGDSDMDLLSVSSKDKKIAWYENVDGNGNFTTQIVISTNVNEAYSVFAIDIDGDGDIDVLSASSEDDKIIWYENTDGLGNFSSEKIISTTADRPLSVYATDVDGDGDIDVISASSTDDKIAWYENTDGVGNFATEQIITQNADGAYAVYAQDIDGDGDIDVLSASSVDDKIAWYENLNGQGSFSAEKTITTNADAARSVYATDLDGDGDIDVLSASYADDKIAWYENVDGIGNFGATQIISSSAEGASSVQAVDIDTDGDMDVVSASFKNHTISWYENIDGAGSFSSNMDITNQASQTYSSHSADLDGDGDMDIISASYWGDKIEWYRNSDGQGDFDLPNIILQNAVGASSVSLADLDNDGDLDILGASYQDSQIFWYENLDGQGALSDQKVITTISNNSDTILAVDIDGDGDIDVIATCRFSFCDTIEWYENLDGLGNYDGNPRKLDHTKNTFLNPSIMFNRSLDAIDLDADGDLDLVSTKFSPEYVYDEIEWFENLDGNGNFGIPTKISEFERNDDGAESLTTSDVDGDGDFDIICAFGVDDKIAWYENTDGQGNFSVQRDILINEDKVQIVESDDIDGDGDMDIVYCSDLGDKLAWSENYDGMGNFNPPIVINLLDNKLIKSIKLKDIDGDGDLDIITASQWGNTVSWYENTDGQGDFGQEQILTTTATAAMSVFTSDLDGDFDMDIISASRNDNKIVWFENLGSNGNEINGNVLLDMDNNGCDVSDLQIQNLMITTSNSENSFSTFSKSDGSYSIKTNEGDFTTKISSPIPNYLNTTPISQFSDFTGTGNIDKFDFCLQSVQPTNNLQISILPMLAPRPGFRVNYRIVYKNIGTTQLTGVVSFTYDDSKMSFIDATEEPENRFTPNLEFQYTGLQPFESRTIIVELDIFSPPTTNIGETLSFTSTINPVAGDNTEEDNTFILEQILIGSYDPNDITVLEGEEVHIDNSADYLNYVIRFQNTGTASAINVKIDHELDADLDWETFVPISSSHTNTISITDGKDVEFLFENINLPDSTSNEPASHGHVAFKIKPKSDIVVGDVVQGKASIYFDFNPPIITNTVNTEFVDIEPLISSALEINPISCPGANDAEIQINAVGGTPPYRYELLDDNSNILVPAQSNNFFIGLGVGNYITRVIDSDGEESFFDIVLQEPLPINITAIATDVTCFGSNDGQLEVSANGGTTPYNYRINGGAYQVSNLFENLSSGEYNIETIDANGCNVLSSSIVITEPVILSMITTKTDLLCKGALDGQIKISTTGGTAPYQYRLDGGTYQNNDTFNNLSAGQYTVETVDANGCVITELVEIIEPTILTATTTVMEVSCKGLNDGNISITASGGTSPFEYSLDGTSFSTNNEFSGLSPSSYVIWSRDSNGCTVSNQVIISEPNSPDFDNDGVGDSCDDDIDGDGVANENDKCSETPSGSSVDSVGCLVFSLPADNFTVQTTSASCPNSNNGSFSISAILPYDYNAVLMGSSVDESKSFENTTNFENLGAGTYNVCITIAEHSDFVQCFSVEITEPEALSVSSKMDTSDKSVVLNLSGGINYSVNLNGTIYNTDENEIMLPLSKIENRLTVSTDIECQGIYEETILMVFGLSVYPNPVEKGDITVILEDSATKDVQLSLYTSGGRRILEKTAEVENGVVKINMEGFATGMYSLKIETSNETYTRKIIKK